MYLVLKIGSIPELYKLPGPLWLFSWKKHRCVIWFIYLFLFLSFFCICVCVFKSWSHFQSRFTVCWVCLLFSAASLVQCWTVFVSDVIIFRPLPAYNMIFCLTVIFESKFAVFLLCWVLLWMSVHYKDLFCLHRC